MVAMSFRSEERRKREELRERERERERESWNYLIKSRRERTK